MGSRLQIVLRLTGTSFSADDDLLTLPVAE
jgi:hypothetical protein